MKVLILAGGYGTRLYPLVKDTPKVLLEVNGKTLVNYIIDRVKDIDSLNEVIVVTNDKYTESGTDMLVETESISKMTYKKTILIIQ